MHIYIYTHECVYNVIIYYRNEHFSLPTAHINLRSQPPPPWSLPLGYIDLHKIFNIIIVRHNNAHDKLDSR